MINGDSIPMNISCFRSSKDGTDSQRFGDEVSRALALLRDVAATKTT
jgi:hypothetical protein